jgi:hypothetical protein
MTIPTLLQLVPAFILGCILTEIRWIVRMRRLRSQLGGYEAASQHGDERVMVREREIANSATFDPAESLRNLSLQLAAEAPVKLSPERPAPLKS